MSEKASRAAAEWSVVNEEETQTRTFNLCVCVCRTERVWRAIDGNKRERERERNINEAEIVSKMYKYHAYYRISVFETTEKKGIPLVSRIFSAWLRMKIYIDCWPIVIIDFVFFLFIMFSLIYIYIFIYIIFYSPGSIRRVPQVPR